MAKAVIRYDDDLPEIRHRRPWERPTSYLVRDDEVPTGWREDCSGRRPSNLLLVPKVREAVDAWRNGGYEGASDVTRRLFEFWFDEDHIVDGFDVPFRYYFCQREAIETLVWLVEIAGQLDVQALIKAQGSIQRKDLLSMNLEFRTTPNGIRRIRRYVPELNGVGEQDLPPDNLRRFAFKMATGSGKTWAMAMAVVWSRFHKQLVPGSELSTNFLIVAPNVIVYQRLEKDFANNQVFHELPLIPPEWYGTFSQKVILRGEAAEPDPSGNLFLTNIHQLYESRYKRPTPQNAAEFMLGKKPVQDLAASGHRSMLDRVKSLPDLVVLNDEAHHVHREDLTWSQSLLSINDKLPRGLSMWLDFSATPKDQNGMYFPWTVVDYPLAQAVEDRIVKAPIIVSKEDDPDQPAEDPNSVNKKNVVEKYGYWLRAAVQRWKEHWRIYRKLNMRPVLFVMAEKNAHADVMGEYLCKTEEFGFKESEVLVIHTDNTGEIRRGDIEKARKAARDIDKPESRIKVIVSVMMLREGWNVRNVTVVLGLRPFTATAEILPEQAIGRGLRLMTQISPDQTQTLEVLGTRNLLNVLRHQLEVEGVGVVTTKKNPPLPVYIEPVLERLNYDIAIPITKPTLTHDFRKVSALKVHLLEAIHQRQELSEAYRIRLRMEFATTETEVHQADIAVEPNSARELLASIANKTADRANLTNCFAEIYPIVQNYVSNRCFGRKIELTDNNVRSHLARLELQESIATYIAGKIGELSIERRAVTFEKEDFRLSMTKRFGWKRNLPLMEARKTIFNLVATYNHFEREFAVFLDRAGDVTRFAALGTTEQGSSASTFRIDYLKKSGAIGFYFPDWVVVQKVGGGEVSWIVETKGREWPGTERKDDAARDWCKRVSEATGKAWKYTRINQSEFSDEHRTFGALLWKKALNESSERQREMRPVTQDEIRQWKEEGRG